MQKKKSILYILCLLLFSGIFCGCTNEVTTYTASGYVLEDGVGVEGVKVSTLFGDVFTDQNGYYRIGNLLGATQISVFKDDCVFEVRNKVFYPQLKQDVNFEAYSFYNISGQVTQGGIAVEGATISATGKKGGKTVTDSNGNFVLQNVAGEVSVAVENTSNKYLTYTANKTNNTLSIDCVCALSGKVVENGVGVENILVVSGGNSTYTNANGEFLLNKDSQSNELKFFNDDYYFESRTVLVENTNQNIQVEVFKKYIASGSVICGNQCIENAKVYSKSNPNNFVFTDEQGSFELKDLHGNDTLIVEKQGFKIDELQTSEQIADVVLNATFDLHGKIETDDGQKDDFLIGIDNNTTKTKDGMFVLSGVKFGDVVSASKNGYKSFERVTINSTEEITLTFNKLYDVTGVIKLDGVAMANIVVKIGDKQTITNEQGVYNIFDLFGQHDLAFDESRYYVSKSSDEKISHKNCKIDAELNEYYNAKLIFSALSENKTSEQVEINNQAYTTDEEGAVTLEGLYGERTFVCKLDGYNNKTVTTLKTDCEKTLIFAYSIKGYVTSGDLAVEGAKISYGEDYVLSDENGFYQIDDLTTQTEIVATKQFYNFSGSQIVNNNQSVNFDSTYSIFGNVNMDGADATQVTMYLYSYATKTTSQTNPNHNGEFCFENLSGKYYLYFDKDVATNNLKPTGYNITVARDNYDFSSKGYSVAGRIVCGNLPMSNIKLTAGTSSTKTDEQGGFCFDVLFGENVITPQLKGYTFNPSSIAVDETMDKTTDLVFEVTYEISGKITCGTQNLSGVEVKIKNTDKVTTTNQNGEYFFDHLSGLNELEITKDGYTFVGNTNINGYATYNFTATFLVGGYVKCGDSYLSGVKVSTLSGFATTDENGWFELDGLEYGTELSASKTGYDFGRAKTVVEPQTDLLFVATYTVSGRVTSGSKNLAGATITFKEQTITTDENGCFAISGLTDDNSLTASKQGYCDATNTFSTPVANYLFNLSFAISGKVISVGKGLAGVRVTSQSKSVTTDNEGNYEITGLYGEGMLVLEKEGYAFVGQTGYASPTTLDFTSTYKLTGRVLSGTLPVKDLTVYYLQSSTKTDDNGKFEIYDLNDIVELSLIKDGYNPIFADAIDGYKADLIFNLTYNVSGKITGLTDNSGVKVTAVCGETTFETTTNTNGEYSFDKLFGNATIGFSKDKTKFVPESFATDVPVTKNITAYEIYVVSGKITAGDLAVRNMPVYVGKDIATYTNQNGEYVLGELTGQSSIIAKFEAPNCTTLKTEQFDTSASAQKNFTLDKNDYIYWLYERAYQNLTESNSYSSTMSGTVDAGAGGVQTVGGYRKKGTNGIYLKEDTNYGKTVFGVDPKVAVLTYYDPLTPNNVSYIQHKNVNESLVANYSGQSWTDTNVESYSTKFGLKPTDYTPYIINRNTINSFDDISYSNGITTFTLNLNPTTSTTKYITRMTAYSGQTPNGFNYVKLTYKIDSDGNLISLNINESYTVTVVVTVTCTGKITETFNEINGNSVGDISKPQF